MLRKFGWLAVLAGPLVLGACSQPHPCPDFGGIPAKTKCYYYQTITAVSPESKEVKSTVAESVVSEDQSHLFNHIETKDYHFHTYIAKVDEADFAKIEVGKTYMFVVEPGQLGMKFCVEKECNEAVDKFRPFGLKNR
jgi:hypothetical protein